MTYFSLGSMGSHCSLRGFSVPKPMRFSAFRSHNTAKIGQNGPLWTKSRFPKGPSAARKMLAKCIFGTKMHFASVRPRLFSLSWSGRAAFERGFRLLLACVALPFNGTAHWFMVYHGLPECALRLLGECSESGANTHLPSRYCTFILLYIQLRSDGARVSKIMPREGVGVALEALVRHLVTYRDPPEGPYFTPFLPKSVKNGLKRGYHLPRGCTREEARRSRFCPPFLDV